MLVSGFQCNDMDDDYDYDDEDDYDIPTSKSSNPTQALPSQTHPRLVQIIKSQIKS